MAIALIGAALANGCGGSLPAVGTEGSHCYGNGTCNVGLACLSNLCVDPNPIDASAATGGRGIAGATGAGGGGLTGGAGGTSGSAGTNGTGGTGACSGLSVQAQSCLSFTQQQTLNNEIDLLFMIDNSSSMTEMQQKLYLQLPTFMNVLQSLPNPPSLHIAVVSSDMGAPGDSTAAIMCTKGGDQGQFQSMPRGDCTATTITARDTFISDADNMPNYTDAISKVFQCIALLGDKGCGFENQLASIDRALGAENLQQGQTPNPPSTNVGFLRPEAYLGIVILTDEDDCSAPANTPLYSLNGYQQNIANPFGPIANYRCNQWGHLCTDPGSGQLLMPPLQPPSDTMMTGLTRTLDLTNCMSNDTSSGLLTPVSRFISDIKALKIDPDNQILVAAISAPAIPYTVAWLPESGGQNTQPGELWPVIEHSCGARGSDDVNPEATMNTTDGSFGDPGVRIAQFVNAFRNSVLGSVCDASYVSSMTAIATKLGQLMAPPCITGTIQKSSAGQPICSVVEHLTDSQGIKKDIVLQNCAANGSNPAQCWELNAGGTGCPNGAQLVVTDTVNANQQSESSSVNCSICVAGAAVAGCPCVTGHPVSGCF